MTSRAATWHAPERIGLLPDAIARRYVTGEVLRGEQDPPLQALDHATQVWNASSVRSEAEPIRYLIDRVMSDIDATADGRTGADAWLAPRLHAALRITRAEAADSRLWNFLALRLAPDYVRWRHLGKPTKDVERPTVAASRYSGAFHTQVFSRLWWAAELFRDGTDYGPVVVACGIQDMLNSVLRIEPIHHRPAAQAFITVIRNGTVRTGREVNALSKAVNAAAATLAYEDLAPDDQPDHDAYRAWVEEAETAPAVPLSKLPEGPDDGDADPGAVEVLVPQFARFFAQTPVRGRRSVGGDD